MKMKFTQLSTLLLFCLLSSLAHAQLRPGSKLLTGSLSVNTSSTTYDFSDDEKSQYFMLTPKLGFVTKENRVWGLMANIGMGWRNGDQSSRVLGGGLFLRQYKKIGNSSFSAFLEETIAGLAFHSTTYSSGPISTSDGWLAGLNLNPGLAFQISSKSFLELSVNGIVRAEYGSNITKATDPSNAVFYNSKSKGFSLNSTLQSPFNAMSLGYSFNF